MRAGRELDAVVAEKVMGFEPWPEQDPRWECRAFKAPFIPHGRDAKPCLPPEYSTEIAAAWKVVENLYDGGDGGWNFELSTDQGELLHWIAAFRSVGGSDDREVFDHADTAPHAICLAALKAVAAL